MEILYKDESYKIVGAAMNVYNGWVVVSLSLFIKRLWLLNLSVKVFLLRQKKKCVFSMLG